MLFRPTELDGVMLVDLERRDDDRGFFARAFCGEEFAAQGLESHVAQANIRVLRVDRDDLVDAVHELGDPEETECKRNQFDAVIEMGHSESEAFGSGLKIGAHDAEH